MLSKADNELLTRVGPGTAMGNLMRQYWIPVLLSRELEPGGRPKRVRLLGESLIAYRAGNGQPGLIGEFCPHRRVSLYFGRVEECGMRCAYHGWAFDLRGQCIDMPNEPPESNFKHKVRTTAYPCRERGGVIWTYMGPAAEPPPLPELEWTRLPPEQVFISKRLQRCNYFQALEGGIDSSHINFLHAPLRRDDPEMIAELTKGGFGVGLAAQVGDTAPRFEVVDTDYGVLIGARRTLPDGRYYWRITQFLMPFYTMPPTELDDPMPQSHIWVPMDDEHVVNWMITWHPRRPLTEEELAAQIGGKGSHVVDYAPPTSAPYGDIIPADGPHNDYGMDWEAHRTRRFCGIPSFGMQDQAIQESAGPIVDRSLERLGTSDTAIIQVRKRLLNAAKALRDHGTPPPGQDPASYAVRPASVILPPDVMWVEGAMDRLVVHPGRQLLYA
jgi:phthalate 4,5-dioxygenase oxygenase subunit